MVAAYMRGRGARKELKAATEAVRRALKAHGADAGPMGARLGRFQERAELNSADADARHNAEIMDRCIAKLVDSLRELQQCANGMGDKKEQLGEALKKLKGRIPAADMPPGAAGDDDEDEDQPLGPSPARRKAPRRMARKCPCPRNKPAGCSTPTDSTANAACRWAKAPGEPRDRSRPTW